MADLLPLMNDLKVKDSALKCSRSLDLNPTYCIIVPSSFAWRKYGLIKPPAYQCLIEVLLIT